ncbi:hypothetical protein HYX11_02760 [Candidatus Woesearchaeota archaeon]|nr:hypothetical protein [Candidatus Woesearchaeota archaeon]
MKKSLDDLWIENLTKLEQDLYSGSPRPPRTEALSRLFQEARFREHRWRDGVIFSIITSSVFGLLFYGIVIRGIEREQESRDQNRCVQLAEQQQFSLDLCSNTCFRDSYFKLQREYKVDNFDLAYRIATHKCNGRQ